MSAVLSSMAGIGWRLRGTCDPDLLALDLLCSLDVGTLSMLATAWMTGSYLACVTVAACWFVRWPCPFMWHTPSSRSNLQHQSSTVPSAYSVRWWNSTWGKLGVWWHFANTPWRLPHGPVAVTHPRPVEGGRVNRRRGADWCVCSAARFLQCETRRALQSRVTAQKAPPSPISPSFCGWFCP